MSWTRWNKRDKVWSSATSLLIKVAFSLPFRRRRCCLIGTLRNYDDDGNRNVKKSNRFDEQNDNSARASRVFVHFFAVPSQLRREMTKC